MESVIVKFDIKGWLQSIPLIFYAFLFVSGVPSLIHPIKQKNYLGSLFVVVVATISGLFVTLGVSGSLWFRANIEENCAQNWVSGNTADLDKI